MFKRFVYLLIIVTAIVVFYFGFTIYKDVTKNDEPQSENTNENNDGEDQAVAADVNDNNHDNEKEKENNPFNQKIHQSELNDIHIRDYIHKMSHQKVIAEAKWGFYEITDERLDWLLEGIEATDNDLVDKNTYIEMLQRWRNGDFSSVDKDHNVIWELQGGTIGEATGIMSEEEEKKYIQNTEEGD